VISTSQVARFILWIEKNPATMQMLEMIWPHIQDFKADDIVKEDDVKEEIESVSDDNSKEC
jgi:hypothetical protein